MSSSDRSLSVFLVCALAAIIGLALIVSSCTTKQNEMNRPADMARIKSAFTLNAKCIEARGEWVHENYTDYCKFNK